MTKFEAVYEAEDEGSLGEQIRFYQKCIDDRRRLYEADIKPFIDRLCQLESIRSPRIVVSADYARLFLEIKP